MGVIKKKPIVVATGEPAMPKASGTGNRVLVNMGKTINIGDYETIRVDYGESREVGDFETFEKARNECAASVVKGLQSLIDLASESFRK